MLELIVLGLGLATFLNILFKKINLPTIIGYIATGIILGHFIGTENLSYNTEIKHIAEFGIVFLMFSIGLEFSMPALLRMRKSVFLYGPLQFFLCAIIFYLGAHYIFDISIKSSVLIGCGLSLSSTAIVLKIMNDNGEIEESHGKKSLGILLFQDLAVIPILMLITIFSVENTPIIHTIGKTVLGGVILIVFILIIGKYLIDFILSKVSEAHSNEIFIGSILTLIFGASYLSHFLGLSYSLGALIGGIMLAETHFKHKIEGDLAPFRDILLGVFFITVGMQLHLNTIGEYIFHILGLLFVIIMIKITIIYLIISFFKTKYIAIKTSITLFQIGELAIVVFESALLYNLLPPVIGQILIATTVVSMILTPIVLKYIEPIAQFILCNKGVPKNDIPQEENESHVILIGYGKIGSRVSDILHHHHKTHYIIEDELEHFKKAKNNGKLAFLGDASKSSILESLHINDASCIIISIGKSENLMNICNTISMLGLHNKTIVNITTKKQYEAIKKMNFANIIYKPEEISMGIYENLQKIENSQNNKIFSIKNCMNFLKRVKKTISSKN